MGVCFRVGFTWKCIQKLIYFLNMSYQNGLFPNQREQANEWASEREKKRETNWFRWNFNAHLIALMRHWLYCVYVCVSAVLSTQFYAHFIATPERVMANCTFVYCTIISFDFYICVNGVLRAPNERFWVYFLLLLYVVGQSAID